MSCSAIHVYTKCTLFVEGFYSILSFTLGILLKLCRSQSLEEIAIGCRVEVAA